MPTRPPDERSGRRHAFFDVPRPAVIGHRGSAGHAPENTLASFELALKQGATILESDIHVTRDGVPVLCHDPEVDRTTNGRGAIAQLDRAEVQALDAGYAFQPLFGANETAFPERGHGHRIPTLAEAFEAFPEARFNLELKAPQPALPSAVLDLVAQRKSDALTLLAAGEDAIMQQLCAALREHPSQPALGASLADIVRFVAAALKDVAPDIASMALQVPADFAGSPLVTQRFVEHAHRHAIEVHVWTIDDPEEMDTLLDLGVDGLVTDVPDVMVRRVAARARG